MFSVIVPDRKRKTLLKIIKQRIAPGTIIISDKWKAYDSIPKLRNKFYEHQSVNHSQTFKDPISGACTNLIEGAWQSVLKSKIHVRNYQSKCLGNYLHRRMWMKRHRLQLWNSIWMLLSDVEYQVEIDKQRCIKNEGSEIGKHLSERLSGGRPAKQLKKEVRSILLFFRQLFFLSLKLIFFTFSRFTFFPHWKYES